MLQYPWKHAEHARQPPLLPRVSHALPSASLPTAGVTLARTPQQVSGKLWHSLHLLGCVLGRMAACQPHASHARLPPSLLAAVLPHTHVATRPTHQPLTAQVLNILVGGSPDGKGWFFPDGVNGRIKEPTPLNVRRRGASGGAG